MGFTDFDWRKEAPDVVEKAIALCAGIKADNIGDYSVRLRDLEPEFPYRHDLAWVVWHEIYARRTPCWIYFARSGSVVKIGRSTQVESRLSSLDKQHSIRHELLGTIYGDYREENRLHRRFHKHRVKVPGTREYFWYEPIAEIVNDIIVAAEVLDAPCRWGACMNRDKLKAIIHDVEATEKAIADLSTHKREVYAGCKDEFNPKVLRKIIARRKQDPAARQKDDDLLDQYESALGMTGKIAREAIDGERTYEEAAEAMGVSRRTAAREIARQRKVPKATDSGTTNHDPETGEVIKNAAPQGDLRTPTAPQTDDAANIPVTPAPEGGEGTGTHSTHTVIFDPNVPFTHTGIGKDDVALDLALNEVQPSFPTSPSVVGPSAFSDGETACGEAFDVTNPIAEQLRSQVGTSTDPQRLEREARHIEAPGPQDLPSWEEDPIPERLRRTPILTAP